MRHDPERPALLVDDDHQIMGPLADDPLHIAERGARGDRERRIVPRVGSVDVLDDPLDRGELHVLRQHPEATEPGHGLGHPLPGDGVHVRRDDRMRATRKVGRREVGLET